MAKRNSKKDILRRLDKARDGLFPTKTCPASRHVHIIIKGLLDADGTLARDLHGYDPEHMADSIASVLEDLWTARRWMKWQPNIECGCYGACFGDWWEHLLKRKEPTQDTAAGGCDGTA